MEERRDYIAAVASKVFGEKGYIASIQDIADGANVSKAAIYHYFKSKGDILGYILIKNTDMFLEKLMNRIKESKEKGLDPQESFKKLIEAYAQHVNSSKDRRKITIRERHYLTKEYEKEFLKRERIVRHLMKKELQKISNLEKKIDPNVIIFVIIGTINWLAYWFKEEKDLDIETVIDQNIKVFFHGILKD
jgi:AcrR family transcriptional regulator